MATQANKPYPQEVKQLLERREALYQHITEELAEIRTIEAELEKLDYDLIGEITFEGEEA